MKGKRFEGFLPLVGVVGLLVVWSITTWREWVDPVLLPSPLQTFRALWVGMNGGALGFDFLKTVYRTAAPPSSPP
jgi:ABC-type nitrate/sulfonate/bicarbonate transport system permease component